MVTTADLTNLEAALLNTSGNVPLANRFRALFTLKALAKQNIEAIQVISKGLHPGCARIRCKPHAV